MFWAETAWAMAPPQGQGGEGPEQLGLFWVLIPLLVIFWIFMIQPQRRQQKQHQARMDSLKKGDRVITTGGIYGTVIKAEENSIVLAVGEIGGTPPLKKKGGGGDSTVNIRFAKSSVANVLGDEAPDKQAESRS